MHTPNIHLGLKPYRPIMSAHTIGFLGCQQAIADTGIVFRVVECLSFKLFMLTNFDVIHRSSLVITKICFLCRRLVSTHVAFFYSDDSDDFDGNDDDDEIYVFYECKQYFSHRV